MKREGSIHALYNIFHINKRGNQLEQRKTSFDQQQTCEKGFMPGYFRVQAFLYVPAFSFVSGF